LKTVKPTRKKNRWYEEISLPITKLRRNGGVYIITIPKKIVKEHNLRKGSSVHPFLLVRRRFHKDELPENEEWVKLSKKERLQFEAWKRTRE